MHHQPTESELAVLPTLPDSERIYYFLSRALECEEVWGLSDGDEWAKREAEGRTVLPVWSYETLARACNDSHDLYADSVSLEHFLDMLSHSPKSLYVDILAMPQRPGALIAVPELLGMFESLIDAGTYFVEG